MTILLRRWFVVGLVFTFGGCAKPTGTPSTVPVSANSDAPVAVKVASLQRQTLTWDVEQPGSVQAFEMTPLVAKLSGYVKTITKDLGDPVEAGEVLATIEIPELEREADQKKAMVLQAEAKVEQARCGVTVAIEHVIAAEAMVNEVKAGLSKTQADYDRWESELKRIETLVSQKVIDTQTLDETRKQFRSAASGRDEATAKIISMQAAVREASAKKLRADADLKAAEAEVKLADADAKRVASLLDYRQIRAPYKGVVTGRFIHTGHFLQSSGNRPEPLFNVARLDVVRVFVDVPEVVAMQAVTGTKAVVRLPSLGGKEFNATITRTANVLNPDSRTLRTEIDLPNADGLLRPGMYAVVKIAATVPDAIVAPPTAVLFADETAYCYAVEDGKAVKLRVQVGRNDGKGVQLLGKRRAGLNNGDWQPFTGKETVVTGNLGALADGQAVTVNGG